MENKIEQHLRDIKTALFLILIFIALMLLITLRKIDNINDKLLLKDTTEISIKNLPKNFSYAYDVLHNYNKHIDTNTVIRIVYTMDKFNLTNDKQTFKLALGQLLTESGAKHFKNNEILTSESGALGIGQILPSSAYGYLLKYCKDNDKTLFKQLGCGDFSFVYNKNLNKSDKLEKIKGWLYNKTNNIALWGFIMKKHLDFTKGNIEKSLISYSDGIGGMKNYIDSGGNIKDHEYIVTINNKLNRE